MKSKWTKFIPLLAYIFLFSACNIISPVSLRESEKFYPGQFLAGGVYILKDGEKIKGNIAGFNTTLIIEKDAIVLGDINLFDSQMEVAGHIVGEVNLFGGNTQINESALITGSINQIATELNIDPGAQITGEINSFTFPKLENVLNKIVNSKNIIEWLRPSIWIIFQIVRTVLMAFISTGIIFLFKDPTLKIAQQITNNIAVAWGVGLLISFAIPLVSIVLLITICLSPIGIVLILVLFFANIWGWTAINFIIGENLIRWLKLEWHEEAVTAVGSIILGIIFSVFALIPFVGFLANFMISAVGLGGIVLSKLGKTVEN